MDNINFDESGRTSPDILLKQGASIDGITRKFNYKKFFDDTLSILFPIDFIILPEHLARLKYPSVNRPKLIYTSYDTKATFTFNISPVPMLSTQTKDAAEQFKQLLKKLYPLNEFSSIKEEQLKENCLSWFSYRGHAIDDRTFDIMYVTPVAGQCMIGTFNCVAALENQWKEVVIAMMRSIETPGK